ncbi:Phospholipid phosphatase-related protein type 2 [Varanus komodoensis]|nr:Phospholipid phosphatase-related protein type 2 [Varanus komodoensis]
MIFVGELAAFFLQPERRAEKTIISGECCYFNPLLRRIIRFLGIYSFGLFTTTIFANAGQVVTGNQTPHFLSVCRPNYTVLGCQPPPGTVYVTDRAACTGNPALIAAARKAFPSKDAALSAYAVAYTVMYVTLVFQLKGSRLAKPSLCLALLCPAFLVGVVRVAEYRNHWSDVLAGFLTGGAIAVFLVTCVVNNFQSTSFVAEKALPPENVPSAPIVGLPCIDSSLEKLNVPQVRASLMHPCMPSGLTTGEGHPRRTGVFYTTLKRSGKAASAISPLGSAWQHSGGPPLRVRGRRTLTPVASAVHKRCGSFGAVASAEVSMSGEERKITELCSQRSPDPQLCLFPTTPDVLIPSRSVTSEV